MTAGGIEARLVGHDKHFARINGSLDKVAGELSGLHAQLSVIHLAIQRLADGAVSRDATMITTAAALKDSEEARRNALKDAEEARRNASERRWTPTARFLAVLGGMVALAGLIVTIVVLVR